MLVVFRSRLRRSPRSLCLRLREDGRGECAASCTTNSAHTQGRALIPQPGTDRSTPVEIDVQLPDMSGDQMMTRHQASTSPDSRHVVSPTPPLKTPQTRHMWSAIRSIGFTPPSSLPTYDTRRVCASMRTYFRAHDHPPHQAPAPHPQCLHPLRRTLARRLWGWCRRGHCDGRHPGKPWMRVTTFARHRHRCTVHRLHTDKQAHPHTAQLHNSGAYLCCPM